MRLKGGGDGRWALFARPVGRFPACPLLYPSGFEHLPRVVEAFFNDLGQSV